MWKYVSFVYAAQPVTFLLCHLEQTNTQIVGTMKYVALCDLHLSSNRMFSKVTHVVAWITPAFLFRGWVLFSHTDTLYFVLLLLHLWTCEFFSPLAIVNSAVMDTHVQVLPWNPVFNNLGVGDAKDTGLIPGLGGLLGGGRGNSSILAWRIPWTEEPGGLWRRGLPRV